MASTIKKFIKHIIRYNPFDYFVPYLRKFYRKIGIVDFMDDIFYWRLWRIAHFILAEKVWHGDTIGLHNIPQYGPAVLVPNHSHLLDPFFSACRVPRKVRWLSKIENYYTPFFRFILQGTGSIPIRRGESDQNAIRLMKKAILKGDMVGMFPEGTRTKTGVMGRFHTGAARMCIEMNIPYVPCAIINSFHNKPGQKIDVLFGKPVWPMDLTLNYENTKRLTDQMRVDIEALYKRGLQRAGLEAPTYVEHHVAQPQSMHMVETH